MPISHRPLLRGDVGGIDADQVGKLVVAPLLERREQARA